MNRYLPVPEPEFADDLGPHDGVYCTDCTAHPFVALEDIEAHDRWHIERAAAEDPDQADLFAVVDGQVVMDAEIVESELL